MARHKINPGGYLDIPSLDEIKGLFEQRGGDRARGMQYQRHKGSIKTDANGVGLGTVDVSPQYDWSIERITIAGPGAANALVQVCIDELSASALAEVIQLGATGLYSDSFSNKLFVPANSRLYIGVTGAVASSNITYNLQTRLVYNP